MKEYRYNGFDEPIIVNDNGTITYKGYPVEKYEHGYNAVGMASGFSYHQLSKTHYLGEMKRIEELIRQDEYRKAHTEEFTNLHTAEEDIDYFLQMIKEN